MADFQSAIDGINRLRNVYNKADSANYSQKLTVQNLKKPENLASVLEEFQATETEFRKSKLDLDDAIKALHHLDHKTLTRNLTGLVPILLLPVRIETRFINSPVTASPELWVRIFPDDIHANSHEPVLTQLEKVAAESYWKKLAEISRNPANLEMETLKKDNWAAYRTILTGAQRALWAAKSTWPVNWQSFMLKPPEALEFPEQPEIKGHTWTRAPRTQALPDRFVFTIYQNERAVHEQAGEIIPDTVFLGPDPFAAEEAFKKDGEEITFSPDIAWLQDFNKAVSIGLGVKIKLTDAMFTPGARVIERITVLGLLHSADAPTGTQIIEDLFQNHHYSSRGLSLTPQATPTNNTEKDSTGYTKNEDVLPKGYYDIMETDVGPNVSPDLNLMASALGINPEIFRDINHADLAEHRQALAMNKALYPATLSYYFNELMNPAVKPADADRIRDFFTNNVTARGLLPGIRVGDQPYGMLVSSDMTKWNDDAGFFSGMTRVLRELQKVWDSFAASRVSRVGMEGNTSEVLMKIMGLQSGSVSFRQRLGNLPDFSYTLPNINLGDFKNEIAGLNRTIVAFLGGLGFDATGPDNFHPLISNLYFYKRTNEIPANKLVKVGAVADSAFLPKMPVSGLNYIEWLAQKATLAELESVNFSGDTPPRTLLCLLLRNALLSELKHAALKVYNKNDVVINSASFEKSLYNFDKAEKDLTTFELLRGEPRKVNDQKFAHIQTSIGDYLLDRAQATTDSVNITSMRKSMDLLSGLPTLTLEQQLSDFVDLCSYRLDAWQTGLFSKKLQTNRRTIQKGIYVGAYGWVENLKSETHIAVREEDIPERLRPQNGMPTIKLKENAGFTHVPSLNHATAAGLLLAGYHNHATTNNPETYAVNLSSERTRSASSLLEGIRNGQSLEVLLGYQFERALHDTTSSNMANLNVYIQPFRDKYEIENLSIPQQGAPEAQETIDSYPVVNGLKVQKASEGEIRQIVPNDRDATLVLAIRDKLSDTLDACNDLLLAEGAYQLTQGNRDRTAGVLNATLLADVPPEIQVTDTPRSSLFTYTHRITLHLNTSNVDLAEGWTNVLSNRSAMEPGLNQWISQLIGDPRRVICRVAALDKKDTEVAANFISLADLGLQPLDLVYMISEELAGGATELESRIAFLFRDQAAVANDLSVKIEFSPVLVDNEHTTFARLYPLLRAVKGIIGNVRVGNAGDFVSKLRQVSAEGVDPAGIDFADFQGRVEDALTRLTAEFADFNNFAPTTATENDEFNPATFGEFFENSALISSQKDRFEKLELSPEGIKRIVRFQIMASGYGVQLAYPENLNIITTQTRFDLLTKTANVWRILKEKLKITSDKLTLAAAETVSSIKSKLYTDASKAIAGDDFLIIPRFKFSNPEELKQSLDDQAQLLKFATESVGTTETLAIETWVQSVSRVRPATAKFETLRMMTEAMSENEVVLSVAQVPFRPGDSWVGMEFPTEFGGKPFNITGDTVAFTVHGSSAKNVEELQSVLMIDEWTEKIPIDEEITGIAYHYNQPNAAAPQSLILAIEPTGGAKWDWDSLQGILNDTFRRTKTRAVEPDHIMEHEALRVLLPMTIASFDVNEANVSLDYMVLNDKFMTAVKSQSLQLYAKWDKN